MSEAETSVQTEMENPRASRGSLASRALTGSLFSMIGFGGGQVMRLASNLILTRILSPDDFGLMTLVTGFLIGLTMFSDMGLGPSIQQSKRGDDPAFLDTAWTLKIIRGGILLAVSTLLAWPLAIFYQAPQFAHVFPVAAISLFIGGFFPTRIDSAARHMYLGRLTTIELVAQALNIGITVLAALWLQSVWALVFGNVAGAVVQLVLTWTFLPGHIDRFRMEPAAREELVRFGKWIFLSTICGFLLFQGDRLVLGRVLTLNELGIYNIGLFLGTVPMMLGGAIGGRLFIPMYRQHPPGETAHNRRVLAKTRAAVAGLLILGVAILVVFGPGLVGGLYDSRYHSAGELLVLIALLQLPQILTISYDYSALAAGDTRGVFVMQGSRALIYTILVSFGAYFYGLPGVLAGQGIAYFANYPIAVWLARKHAAWDRRHDLIVLLITLMLAAIAFSLHGAEIAAALQGG
ncbi:oligosaccharide flippase family protein [Paracoccus aminophilus]|uniref:Polysaccharide biosynthesis protein n=1 Tax=Paracoccus aminophilus JCM 7686 TaxID=1367847 RepID=S5XRW0_PARAH|nr:oligosaccharide flippase family protein [Paracoccus aminophilus]AGT10164.1 polysaccharide biosynthesis protein [Paracoccus aminophilus JCM 7686]